LKVLIKPRLCYNSNVKLGNCGRFARTPQEFETLLAAVGPEAVG